MLIACININIEIITVVLCQNSWWVDDWHTDNINQNQRDLIERNYKLPQDINKSEFIIFQLHITLNDWWWLINGRFVRFPYHPSIQFINTLIEFLSVFDMGNAETHQPLTGVYWKGIVFNENIIVCTIL